MCNFCQRGKVANTTKPAKGRSHKEHKTHLKKRPLIDRVTMSPKVKMRNLQPNWHNGHYNNKKLGHQSRPSKQVYY